MRKLPVFKKERIAKALEEEYRGNEKNAIFHKVSKTTNAVEGLLFSLPESKGSTNKKKK